MTVERTSQLAMVQELVSLSHGVSMIPAMARQPTYQHLLDRLRLDAAYNMLSVHHDSVVIRADVVLADVVALYDDDTSSTSSVVSRVNRQKV